LKHADIVSVRALPYTWWRNYRALQKPAEMMAVIGTQGGGSIKLQVCVR